MKLRILAGKNKKWYCVINDLQTKLDMEIYDHIKTKVLSRSEYMPFIQSFNKTISYSYLFQDILFPVQFLDDVLKQVKSLFDVDLKVEGLEQIKYNIERKDFDEFVSNLHVPDFIKTDDDNYKFQQDSAYLALTNKIGRIELATSAGKTFVTYMYCKYIIDHIRNNDNVDNEQILIIVPSKLLVKQLQKDFNNYQQKEDKKIIVESIFAGSKRIIGADIVCGTYQSLSNYDTEYFETFRFIICDECHRAKAYSIKNDIYNKTLNAEWFFGMSGTFPKYNSLDYLHIVSMFGPILYTRSVKELIDTGVSTPVQVHVIKIKYPNHKTLSTNLIESGIIGSEKYRLEKEFFHECEERTNLISKLLKHYTDNSLILVDTVDYCQIIKDSIEKYFATTDITKDVRIIHGNVNNRDQIIDDMKNTLDNFVLVGTYGTMSTGVSIPNIASIFFVDGGKSNIRIRQSIGRGIRLAPNKKVCDVFDFYDDIPKCSFSRHARERIKIYKEQNLPFKISEVKLENFDSKE